MKGIDILLITTVRYLTERVSLATRQTGIWQSGFLHPTYFIKLLLPILILMPAWAFAQLSLSSDVLSINGIDFRLHPEVMVKNAAGETKNLTFAVQTIQTPSGAELTFTNDLLNLQLALTPQPNLGNSVWQANITAHYLDNVSLYTLAMRFDWVNPNLITAYLGTAAVRQRSVALNQDLCPYRDKIVEYTAPDSSIWVIGSNYEGCEGVERITANTVYFYDYRLHYGRLYDKARRRFEQKTDIKPCSTNQSDSYSFLLSAEKPLMPRINRWLGDRQAALSISNDADGGNGKKIYALFWGSSVNGSPQYLTKGIFANHIKLSNTIFGADYDNQYQIWASMRNRGIDIGYHTYTKDGDFTRAIKDNLLTQLQPFNIRMWIDHSWANNAEDFCRTGTDPDSPYYIIDVINNSNIDYAWMGDLPSRNEFNAFDDPWRLPHRIYEFTRLTRPVWFYGRTRMETLEYYDERHTVDMKYNLTRQNLDKLLAEGGLSLIYTHFFFDDTPQRRTFFEILENGECEIRDDANAYFELLNEYQTQRKLWVDTTENIFDRMLAIEQVRVVNVTSMTAGYQTVTVENGSDYDLDELLLDFDGKTKLIPLLRAGSRYSFTLSSGSRTPGIKPAQNLFLQYQDSSLYLKSIDNELLSPMHISIFNVKGQCLVQTTTPAQRNMTILPFASHPSGIYFARIKPLTGNSFTLKFIVLR